MGLLLFTSALWGLSFGLIKDRLSGLDASFVAAARLALAAAVFLPFVLRGRVRGRTALELLGIGAIQFGLMYVLYIRSYASLAAWQVALFTVLTPLHVVLLEGLWRGGLRSRHLAAALLAVAGAACISWRPGASLGGLGRGFGLVQLANLCFAFGQVAYRARVARDAPHAACMGWAYLGAVALATTVCLATADLGALRLSQEQALALAYLGLVASGLGFFLWNLGATRVRVGLLAVLNNLKVPLGVLFALTLFGESADAARLCGGSLLIGAALWVGWERGQP